MRLHAGRFLDSRRHIHPEGPHVPRQVDHVLLVDAARDDGPAEKGESREIFPVERKSRSPERVAVIRVQEQQFVPDGRADILKVALIFYPAG